MSSISEPRPIHVTRRTASAVTGEAVTAAAIRMAVATEVAMAVERR